MLAVCANTHHEHQNLGQIAQGSSTLLTVREKKTSCTSAPQEKYAYATSALSSCFTSFLFGCGFHFGCRLFFLLFFLFFLIILVIIIVLISIIARIRLFILFHRFDGH